MMIKLDFPSKHVTRASAQYSRRKIAEFLDCELYCSGLRLPDGRHVWRITEPFKGKAQ